MISHKQLSLEDIYSDCQNIFENDKPAFLSLLETHIDLDEIIPVSFYNHFYASTGRSRKYPLTSSKLSIIYLLYIIQRQYAPIKNIDLPITQFRNAFVMCYYYYRFSLRL